MDQNDVEKGIANEVRVIKKLCENGGHPNVITVLEHGWINTDDIYYFDMELCSMSLDDFINGSFAKDLDKQYFDPLGLGDGPKCLTLWTIMRHITSGLEYIHSLHEVHRDLKPQNGICTR